MTAPGLRLAMALLAASFVLLTAVSDSVYDKQQQLQGLNGQIVTTKTQIKQLLDQENAIKQQIAGLDAQLKAVALEIDQEQSKLAVIAAQVEQAKTDLKAKEAELVQHLSDFGKRMRVMYKSGQVSGLELVLSAVNFTDLLNRVFFFNDIVRDDRRQVEALRLERASIEVMKADLEVKHSQQAEVVNSIQDQRAQLQTLRGQRAGAEQQVAAIEVRFAQELSQMEAQRETLQSQIAAVLGESLRAHSSGKWRWPVDGMITQGFGCTSYPFEPYDPSCASRHFHSGIDIANDTGTTVHASDGGIVHNYTMSCSWGGLCGYGHYVIVVHAGGFTTLYGHLSGYAIADGTQVDKDTVIGYVGSTGASTGPHLHFEIDLSGMPVDPLAYLPAA